MTSLLDDLHAELGNDEVLVGEAARELAESPWTRLGAPLAVPRPH